MARTASSHITEHHRGSLKRLALVIEDNDLNREILVEILSENYEVIEAHNGEEGIQMLTAHYRELSIVLLDVHMPVCNGFQFLERTQGDAMLSSVPVIVTTASNRPEDEVKCLQLGAADFVCKPYNPAVVLGRIRSAIRLRESVTTLSAVEYDTLTDAYTLPAFLHHAKEFLLGTDEPCDLLVAQARGLHLLRQAYGNQKTEEVLLEIVREIRQMNPESIVARKDNAIMVLIPSNNRPTEQRLRTGLRRISKRLGVSNVRFSIGMYQDVDKTQPVAILCDRATLAASALHDEYTTIISVYSSSMEEKRIHDQKLEASFADALENDEFIVLFQPKVDAETGKVIAVEALVRWKGADEKIIYPSEFIPLFERDGLISQLDEYVFRKTCCFQRRQMESGRPLVPISINLSRNSLFMENVASRYLSIAEAEHVPPSLIPLEITESAAANDSYIMGICKDLVQAGFSLHLDDFGTGFSSLTSLITFPFDVLKLDKSMVDYIGNKKGDVVLRSIIRIAQDLNMTVVAEGVEERSQVDYLASIGCNTLQGYYFSKPVESSVLEDMLEETFALQKDREIEVAADIEKESVSQEELERYLRSYRSVFPTVRTFDGLCYSCRIVDDEGSPGPDKHPCFLAWNRKEPCENCIVKTAINLKSTTRKFEVLDDEVFMVIAKYLEVNGKPFAIEMMDRVGGEALTSFQKDPSLAAAINRVNQEIYHDVQLDIFNRRYFEEQVDSLKNVTAVAMIDLDGFKDVNDTFGHYAGDVVLRKVADTIKDNVRHGDALIRFGGDEIFIAFSSMKEEFLFERLDEIRDSVDHLVFEEFPEIHMTVSIGGCVCSRLTKEAAIKADEQMYLAKKTRNRVSVTKE